ncbi:MAG: zinc transporter ZupT [Syntrophomonadaceae bacterium]|nr:zinc transporter ZupT [Syntrophomonadaceae bacterium]
MFSDQVLIALGLSFVAGLSTLIGFITIFIKIEQKKMVSLGLGFAAGVMLSVSFGDLFPEAQHLMSVNAGSTRGLIASLLFLMAGMAMAAGMDRFVPHAEENKLEHDKPHEDLFRVGFVSMLAIMLHNFPEGMATFMAGYNDLSLGFSIALAISLHNIPEGIAVAVPIYHATGRVLDSFKYTLLAGIAEPIGGILAFLVLRPFLNDFVLGASFALVAGMMIYISMEELIPSSRQYGYKRMALIATLAGICIMPLTQIFF